MINFCGLLYAVHFKMIHTCVFLKQFADFRGIYNFSCQSFGMISQFSSKSCLGNLNFHEDKRLIRDNLSLLVVIIIRLYDLKQQNTTVLLD